MRKLPSCDGDKRGDLVLRTCQRPIVRRGTNRSVAHVVSAHLMSSQSEAKINPRIAESPYQLVPVDD